ncbi:MAG: DegV family protein [Caldisericaceae bacterium]
MVKIVTDSTAYFEDGEAESLGVKVVPLYVKSNGVSFREGIDISDDEFYRRLGSGEVFETSQPSPQDFLAVYKPIIEQGDEIVSIHISSKLSGTVNSANLAKGLLKTDKITVVDSLSSSTDLLYKVQKAVELAKAGASREDIASFIDDYYKKVFGYFLPMNIDYLARGGRINNFEKTISNIMKLYFIVHLNEGRIDLLKISRTERGAKDELLNLVSKFGNSKGGIAQVSTIYGGNVHGGENYRKIVEDYFSMPVQKRRVGPVLGSHLGPEFLGIAFITKEA